MIAEAPGQPTNVVIQLGKHVLKSSLVNWVLIVPR